MNSWITIIDNHDRGLEFVSRGYKRLAIGKVRCYYNRDGRFAKDQLFFADDNELIIIDGVILNINELKEKKQVDSLLELYLKRDQDSVVQLFSTFTGPFCGVHYDKKNDRIMAFGNQTGDAPIFYYYHDGVLIVSNDMNLIIYALRSRGVLISFNEDAALYIMTFGYMIDNSTMINEIHRLMPGEYLSGEGDKLENFAYFKYENKNEDIPDDEAVELIDHAFRQAVKRCFDKDIEYGYNNHLADISGGLDSRMVNWVAKDLGYSNIVNISYSQAKSDEHNCAMQVSYELKNTLLHEQLDDASFLYDVDEIVQMEYGLAPYYAVTGGNTLLKLLDFRHLGLEHTGQLGDVLLGTYTQRCMPIDTPYKRYSYLLDVEIPRETIEKYNELEDFLIYTRGFLGMLSTHLIRRHYTYAVSPFLDIDFLDISMRIPLHLKRGQLVYWRWIDQKYPDVGKIKSTRERPASKVATFEKRVTGKAAREIQRALYRIGLSKSMVSVNNMNPIQYWFDTDQNVARFINSYTQTNIHLLGDNPKTLKNIERMMKSANATDKLLALTVIASYKLCFGV